MALRRLMCGPQRERSVVSSGLQLLMRDWVRHSDKSNQVTPYLHAYMQDSTDFNRSFRAPSTSLVIANDATIMMKARQRHDAQELARLFEKAPRLPFPLTVYRGCDAKYIMSNKEDDEEEVIERGFLSTTTSIDCAAEFATRFAHVACPCEFSCPVCIAQQHRQPRIMRFTLPTGTPFFYPDFVTQPESDGCSIVDGVTTHGNEDELLLAPSCIALRYPRARATATTGSGVSAAIIAPKYYPFAQPCQQFYADGCTRWKSRLVWIPVVDLEARLLNKPATIKSKE